MTSAADRWAARRRRLEHDRQKERERSQRWESDHPVIPELTPVVDRLLDGRMSQARECVSGEPAPPLIRCLGEMMEREARQELTESVQTGDTPGIQVPLGHGCFLAVTQKQ